MFNSTTLLVYLLFLFQNMQSTTIKIVPPVATIQIFVYCTIKRIKKYINLNILHISLNIFLVWIIDPNTTLMNRLVLEDLYASERYLRLQSNINLTNKAIVSIDAQTFFGLDKIISISLDQNEMNYLPDQLFYGLNNLKEINLSYNYLNYLPTDLFSNLTKLTLINLKSNKLIALPSNIFQGFIIYLYFFLSKYFKISKTFQKDLSSLKSLDISYNQLTILDDKVFQYLTQLEIFNANNNLIENIPSLFLFNKMTSLQQLRLDSNKLFFSSSTNNLSSIDFANCPFSNLMNLTFFSLSNNSANGYDTKTNSTNNNFSDSRVLAACSFR